jgi:hypothetical protein
MEHDLELEATRLVVLAADGVLLRPRVTELQ